jgi:hypothetical protein
MLQLVFITAIGLIAAWRPYVIASFLVLSVMQNVWMYVMMKKASNPKKQAVVYEGYGDLSYQPVSSVPQPARANVAYADAFAAQAATMAARQRGATPPSSRSASRSDSPAGPSLHRRIPQTAAQQPPVVQGAAYVPPPVAQQTAPHPQAARGTPVAGAHPMQGNVFGDARRV